MKQKKVVVDSGEEENSPLVNSKRDAKSPPKRQISPKVILVFLILSCLTQLLPSLFLPMEKSSSSCFFLLSMKDSSSKASLSYSELAKTACSEISSSEEENEGEGENDFFQLCETWTNLKHGGLAALCLVFASLACSFLAVFSLIKANRRIERIGIFLNTLSFFLSTASSLTILLVFHKSNLLKIASSATPPVLTYGFFLTLLSQIFLIIAISLQMWSLTPYPVPEIKGLTIIRPPPSSKDKNDNVIDNMSFWAFTPK